MSAVRTFTCDCGRIVITNDPGRTVCLGCEDELAEEAEAQRAEDKREEERERIRGLAAKS